MSVKQYSFVVPLEFLEIDENLSKGLDIAADLKLSNSTAIAQSLVSRQMQSSIGRIESNSILSGKPYLYAVAKYPLKDSSPQAQISLLNTRLMITLSFCNTLWIVKDNSVTFDRGFFECPYKSFNQSSRVSLNSWTTRFSTAQGQSRCERFTSAELKAAIGVYNALFGQNPSDEAFAGLTPGTAGSVDRLSRSFYFLQGARAMTDLPHKIANYCTCFETLVSTAGAEVSHQVAERVAILIGDDDLDPFDVYNNLKRAYTTRSKLIHGSELKTRHDQYLEQSENCDDYLRRLMVTILSDSSIDIAIRCKPEELNRFFLSRLLRH